MLEQELQNIWQSSSQSERVKFDLSRLLIELNTEMKNIEKDILARDRRETAAALLGIIIFSYFAYEIPFPLTKAACVLAIAWMIGVIFILRGARKKQSSDDMSLPYRQQLTNQKNFLLQQKKLFSNVLYWYALPPFLMNVVFIAGIGDPAAYDWSSRLLEWLPLTFDEKIKTIIILFVFYTVVWLINKSTVKNRYEPAIKEIERVERQIE